MISPYQHARGRLFIAGTISMLILIQVLAYDLGIPRRESRVPVSAHVYAAAKCNINFNGNISYNNNIMVLMLIAGDYHYF